MTSKKKLRKVSGVNWVRFKWLKGLHKLKGIAFYNSTERRKNKNISYEKDIN